MVGKVLCPHFQTLQPLILVGLLAFLIVKNNKKSLYII